MIAGCTAYDLIILKHASKMARESSRSISGSECMFRFGFKYSTSMSFEKQSRLQQQYSVYLIVVHPITGDTMRFPISPSNTVQSDQSFSAVAPTPLHDEATLQRIIEPFSEGGPYNAHYILISTTDDEIIGIAPFDIYVWHSDCKVAVVDVDGTITTSTLTGFWNTAVLHDYSSKHCHGGVCRFLSHLVDTASCSNLRVLYLTNRPITYVEATRNLLANLLQDGHPLPRGPLIGFMGDLAGVFKVQFYCVCSHHYSQSDSMFCRKLSVCSRCEYRWIFIISMHMNSNMTPSRNM